jgi:hypothetical protein
MEYAIAQNLPADTLPKVNFTLANKGFVDQRRGALNFKQLFTPTANHVHPHQIFQNDLRSCFGNWIIENWVLFVPKAPCQRHPLGKGVAAPHAFGGAWVLGFGACCNLTSAAYAMQPGSWVLCAQFIL